MLCDVLLHHLTDYATIKLNCSFKKNTTLNIFAAGIPERVWLLLACLGLDKKQATAFHLSIHPTAPTLSFPLSICRGTVFILSRGSLNEATDVRQET